MGARGGSWLAVLFAAGCYHPTVQLDVPCTAEGACPSGQMCVSDHCVADGAPIDSSIVPDARSDAGLAVADAAIDAPAPATIVFKSELHVEIPAAQPVTSIVVPRPQCPKGAVMIGTIAMGVSGAQVNPTLSAPVGWTLVRRLDHPFDLALAVYVHVADTTDPGQYTWTMSNLGEGVAWIACYLNVDPVNPIADDNGIVESSLGPVYAYPSVAPTVANTMILGVVAGHSGAVTTWTPPPGTTERIDVQNGTSRSGTLIDHLDLGTGMTAMSNETASHVQDFALLEVLALRPKP
jgi:hypothetical protein